MKSSFTHFHVLLNYDLFLRKVSPQIFPEFALCPSLVTYELLSATVTFRWLAVSSGCSFHTLQSPGGMLTMGCCHGHRLLTSGLLSLCWLSSWLWEKMHLCIHPLVVQLLFCLILSSVFIPSQIFPSRGFFVFVFVFQKMILPFWFFSIGFLWQLDICITFHFQNKIIWWLSIIRKTSQKIPS